jgi:hypothetical protein
MQQTILHHSLFALLPTPQPLHHSLNLFHSSPDIPLRIHDPLNLLSTNKLSHLRPGHQHILHMPAHTPLGQLDYYSLAHIQPAHKIQVALAILRKETQICNNTLCQFQDMVCEHTGLREDHTLAGTVGQVPLIPQGIVQQFWLHHSPDNPGQSTYLFTLNRIALVGHGGRTHLAFAKTFLYFCDLAALQRAKFHAYLIQGSDRVCHPHHELSMPIPLYDLGGYLSINKKSQE